MEFTMGKALVKVSFSKEKLMIIFPIGDHVVSVSGELFRTTDSPNSMNFNMDIYQKDDLLATGKVQRELEGL